MMMCPWQQVASWSWRTRQGKRLTAHRKGLEGSDGAQGWGRWQVACLYGARRLLRKVRRAHQPWHWLWHTVRWLCGYWRQNVARHGVGIMRQLSICCMCLCFL